MRLSKLFHAKTFVALLISLSTLWTAQAQTPRHRVLTARQIARKAFPSVVMIVLALLFLGTLPLFGKRLTTP